MDGKAGSLIKKDKIEASPLGIIHTYIISYPLIHDLSFRYRYMSTAMFVIVEGKKRV